MADKEQLELDKEQLIEIINRILELQRQKEQSGAKEGTAKDTKSSQN